MALAAMAGHLGLLILAWWAPRHLLPDTLTLHLAGKANVLAGLHRRLTDRVVIAGMLVPGVFWLEYLWMGWRDCSVRHLLVERTPSARSDLSCFLLGLSPTLTLVTAGMSLGVVLLTGEWLRQLLIRAVGLDLSIAGEPQTLQTGVLLLLYSLFDYWSHRLDHSQAFWPLHRFHHAAEDFTVLTAGRTHPAVFTAVVGTTLPGLLLGSRPEAVADVGLIVMILRLVIHSRIPSDFGWVGRWIVQSPLHHRQHHSLHRLPANLSLLPIWDRLFGTWREAPGGPMRIGVATPYRQGAWIAPDIWRDYCEFWGGVRRVVLGRAARGASFLRMSCNPIRNG